MDPVILLVPMLAKVNCHHSPSPHTPPLNTLLSHAIDPRTVTLTLTLTLTLTPTRTLTLTLTHIRTRTRTRTRTCARGGGRYNHPPSAVSPAQPSCSGWPASIAACCSKD